MMTLETFAEELESRVRERAGNHYEVSLDRSLGNNGTKIIRMIVKGKDSSCGTAPAAVLNPYYDWLEGRENEGFLENIAEEIACVCCSPGISGNDRTELAGQLMDYDFCRDKLRLKLINTGLNRELLENLPHIPFLDLSVVFYVALQGPDGMEMATQVNSYLKEAWKVTTEELYQQALRNTREKMPAAFVRIGKISCDRGKMQPETDFGIIGSLPSGEKIEDDTLYCLTNHLSVYGAAVLLYPGLLKECTVKSGKDILILPSSVHEVLFISLSDESKGNRLSEIVRDINQSDLEPEQVLSDHIYRYDYRNDRVVMA